MLKKKSAICYHDGEVSRQDREEQNGHRALCVWFTGLSAAGKSTLACEVEKRLFCQEKRAFMLDGDNVRHGLCADLSFSNAHRNENLRRIIEMTRLFLETGTICLCSFIAPLQEHRNTLRAAYAPKDFFLVYCNASLEICEQRDPKGYYKRARRGEIKNYTGISSPYETPAQPDLVVNTGTDSLTACADAVMDAILPRIKIH